MSFDVYGFVSNGSNYTIIIDSTDSNNVYFGWAQPGSATSDSVWRIQKKVTSGGIQYFYWCNASTAFNYVWDNRASYSFS